MFYRAKHLKFDARAAMRQFRVQVLIAVTAILMLIGAAIAIASPDFGPGQTQNVGPHAPNAKCHPPGQELPSPECKEDR